MEIEITKQGEHTYIWNNFRVGFEAFFHLEQGLFHYYDNGSEDQILIDNEDYRIDIYAFTYHHFQQHYQRESMEASALYYVSRQYRNHVNVQPGGPLPRVNQGYYIITDGFDADPERDLVLVAIALDEKDQRFYEFKVYSFKRDLATSRQIIESFMTGMG